MGRPSKGATGTRKNRHKESIIEIKELLRHPGPLPTQGDLINVLTKQEQKVIAPVGNRDLRLEAKCFNNYTTGAVVFTSYSATEIYPKILDFGEIDVGSVSDMKKLIIKNTGTKQATYSIDAGKDQFELIIQPSKGTIFPGQQQEISIEVFGTIQGVFRREFWVKTDPLQRIRVQGRFIEPMLNVEYPFAESNSVLLSYPVTFVGTKRCRNVIFRNRSSFSSVFCVLRKIPGIEGERVPYEDGRQNDDNCRQFNVFPLEGKLNSDEQCLLEITYEPHDPLNGRTFHITPVFIEFVKCMPGFETKSESYIQEDSTPSEVISVTTLDEDNQVEREIDICRPYVAMYLYGEIELPKVTLNPDKIHLQKLIINEIHVQQFTILNNSETLPLILRYKKLPSIEIVPKEILLPPSELTFSTLKIRPSKMGEESVSVTFDLLYQTDRGLTKVSEVYLKLSYNGEYSERDKLAKKRKKYFLSGITPDITNEVGYLVDDVKFNSKIQKPVQAVVDKSSLVFNKNDGDLVAFPNDRIKSLRPWRDQYPCKTIFAKLPRIVTTYDKSYDLTAYQKFLKDKSRLVYNSFIRQKKRIPPSTTTEDWTDYDTTNSKLLLLENREYLEQIPSSLMHPHKKALFVPLTPYEIRNIIVTPKFIQLGLLGANTKCSCCFSLENKNIFPIHVAVNALFPTIEFVEKEFILSSTTKRDVTFIYHTTGGGKKHNTLFIILNFFYTFNVTVLATIAANTVKCITKTITIAKSGKNNFLELVNPINSDVKFEIVADFLHFVPFPARGVIPANRHMTCAISYNPEVGYTPMKEITVVSESGSKELLEIVFEKTKSKIELSTDKVVFGDIPLNTNVSNEITIRNRGEDLISATFSIEKSELYPEITISPKSSLIFQNGFIVVTVTGQFKKILSFNVTINMDIQDQLNKKITLTGNVVLPEIAFDLNFIKLPKIPSNAVLRTPFKMENTTAVENYVTFCLEDYPEFALLTRTEEKIDKYCLHNLPDNNKMRPDSTLSYRRASYFVSESYFWTVRMLAPRIPVLNIFSAYTAILLPVHPRAETETTPRRICLK
ncbi:cilia and flagella-associated protein 47-like [Rhynchophorus ferrugineus]|uniref:cilia and flagella-associated protein 47-like n=1 Tax=Rhynchophorus ferrugineus TaxID=354439 RepID=UPI003FCCC48B